MNLLLNIIKSKLNLKSFVYFWMLSFIQVLSYVALGSLLVSRPNKIKFKHRKLNAE